MRDAKEIICSLYDRGAMPFEISELTDFPERFVKRIIREARINTERNFKLVKFPARKWVSRSNKERSTEIAKKIIKKELISSDLLNWNRLLMLYEKNKRPLPESFSDRLRLEVFLAGIINAKRGDHTLLTQIMDLETSISLLFSEANLEDEKDFIGENFAENPVNMKHDQIGYFREDENGRWRQPIGFTDKGIIVDSPSETLRREIARKISVSNRKENERFI